LIWRVGVLVRKGSGPAESRLAGEVRPRSTPIKEEQATRRDRRAARFQKRSSTEPQVKPPPKASSSTS
jgi:hypothetical protein